MKLGSTGPIDRSRWMLGGVEIEVRGSSPVKVWYVVVPLLVAPDDDLSGPPTQLTIPLDQFIKKARPCPSLIP